MTQDQHEDSSFEPVRQKMLSAGLSQLCIAQFKNYFYRLQTGETGLIPESEIQTVVGATSFDSLSDLSSVGHSALGHTCIVKLNGGLGTSMGLDRAKSLLVARDSLSFLDIIISQTLSLRETHSCAVPLVFMNSFRTESDTERAIAAYDRFKIGQASIPSSFLQNKVPKLCQSTLLPVEYPKDASLEWCPPGHGDIYTALTQSGILDQLQSEGFRYLFVSNADNLGAVLDLRILGYFAQNNIPFLMEVADRTEADKKGGHLARTLEGQLILRESAQCPELDHEAFQDINRHRFFNTNTLWLNIDALKEKMNNSGGVFSLPLIRNKKLTNPSDPASPPAFQLETAMGAAIALFPDSQIISIPRTRFAPVKKNEDLLTLRSDAFVLQKDYQLTLRPERGGTPPVIDLDSKYYQNVSDFEARFPLGAPSLIDCEKLIIKGDIVFGTGVVIKGSVRIENLSSTQKQIPDGTVIDENIIFRG